MANEFKKKHTKEIKRKKQECIECGGNNVFYRKEKNQIICKDCGAVFEELSPSEEKKIEKAHDQW
ncbi:MAG TPA: TFIIB-type zinc ribbon-containing protein [Candidatus Nanoarchaeia archaeon]|nr:TFIIB-type zinc ribbon-containing protein [Candidatus Nanoarchaeia archaeon]